MIKYAQGEKNQFNFVKTSFLTRKYKKITRQGSGRADTLNDNGKALKRF